MSKSPFVLPALVLFALGSAIGAQAQTAPAVRSDVYHVNFSKATPGSAAALAKALATPDPKASAPGRFVVLRHQQGDDWDYCVIEHLGTKATVDAAPAAPNPARPLTAWHADTFVAGPPWAEFAKAMGIDGSGKPGAVYSVSVWQALAGQREKLEAELGRVNPASKVQVGSLVLPHLEGGAWTFARHRTLQLVARLRHRAGRPRHPRRRVGRGAAVRVVPSRHAGRSHRPEVRERRPSSKGGWTCTLRTGPKAL